MGNFKDLIRPIYYKMAHIHVKKVCKNSIERYRQYDGKHIGEVCCIVSNGPSVTIEDLNILSKQPITTIGMNRVYIRYDKTTWRPNYYIIQDPTIIRSCHKEVEECVRDSVIFQKSTGEKKYDIDNAIFYDVDYSRSWKGEKPLFSNGKNNFFYDGNSVTYSAIQLAVFMGFKRIYLIGCDCNYSANNVVNKESYPDPRMYEKDKVGTKPPDIAYQFKAYEAAKKYANNFNIEIINATRGGMLDVFERADFENMIEEIQK